jgi:hypothetical protein
LNAQARVVCQPVSSVKFQVCPRLPVPGIDASTQTAGC